MKDAKAYSVVSATSPAFTTTPRREPTEHDVPIEILFCGICYSDLHAVRNEWGEFMATIVPGHKKVNEAFERLLKSNVKYRFSIDMASLKSE
jgi:uncharacterized zinc-type alcohol dehydrogenase-like protein